MYNHDVVYRRCNFTSGYHDVAYRYLDFTFCNHDMEYRHCDFTFSNHDVRIAIVILRFVTKLPFIHFIAMTPIEHRNCQFKLVCVWHFFRTI